MHRSNSVQSSSSSSAHHAYYQHHGSGSSPMGPFEIGEQEYLQRRLLNAHQIMLMEQAERSQSYEHVIVLGNAVRRMSTIPSLPDADREPWTPNSDTPTFATPRDLTRSPTTSTVATSGARRNLALKHSANTLATFATAPERDCDDLEAGDAGPSRPSPT